MNGSEPEVLETNGTDGTYGDPSHKSHRSHPFLRPHGFIRRLAHTPFRPFASSSYEAFLFRAGLTGLEFRDQRPRRYVRA
jgi:hypothetical protein